METIVNPSTDNFMAPPPASRLGRLEVGRSRLISRRSKGVIAGK
ncbi:hypothetical protein [Saccharothrix xinjiangensis]|uniref:Uncharacterized protein n=1 Tax=Saccharothrix xinjiangensis TaxID=204798 RepID=A0ABV9YB67_9PSEU